MSIGILGILIGIVLLVYCAYRGWSVLVVAPVCAILVALFNGMHGVNAFTDNFMTGTVNFLKTMIPIYISGAVLGEIYNVSGAAASIAKGILGLVKGKQERAGILSSIMIIIVAAMILSYGGINGVVLMFVLFPLALGIMKESNIPREIAPGIVMGGLATAALSMPGSPQSQNVLPMQLLGSSSTAALIPGIIAGVTVTVLNIAYLTWATKNQQRKGKGFTDAQVSDAAAAASDTPQKLPNPIISILPLLLTFILFNFFKIYVVYAIAAGVILSAILLYRYIGDGRPIGVYHAVNRGAASCAVIALASGSMAGFGAVISASPSFTGIAEAVTQISGPPLLVATIALMIVVGICGSGPAGLGVALPMFSGTFASMGISAAALHRVAAFAATTLDTLPTNAGFIAAVGITKVSIKDSYKYVGVCTVINSSIATFLVAALLTLFPGLA